MVLKCVYAGPTRKSKQEHLHNMMYILICMLISLTCVFPPFIRMVLARPLSLFLFLNLKWKSDLIVCQCPRVTTTYSGDFLNIIIIIILPSRNSNNNYYNYIIICLSFWFFWFECNWAEYNNKLLACNRWNLLIPFDYLLNI